MNFRVSARQEMGQYTHDDAGRRRAAVKEEDVVTIFFLGSGGRYIGIAFKGRNGGSRISEEEGRAVRERLRLVRKDFSDRQGLRTLGKVSEEIMGGWIVTGQNPIELQWSRSVLR